MHREILSFVIVTASAFSRISFQSYTLSNDAISHE
jgi:hypothetical protein